MKKKILLFFVFLGIVQMGHAQKFDLELGISKGRTRHEHRPFILNGGINFSVDWFVFYSGVSFNYSSTYNHDPLLPFEEYYSYLSVNNQFVLWDRIKNNLKFNGFYSFPDHPDKLLQFDYEIAMGADFGIYKKIRGRVLAKGLLRYEDSQFMVESTHGHFIPSIEQEVDFRFLNMQYNRFLAWGLGPQLQIYYRKGKLDMGLQSGYEHMFKSIRTIMWLGPVIRVPIGSENKK